MIPVFASTLGQIFSPLFELMAWLIAGFYAVVPNYAIAIAMLTVVVMIVTAPLTVKSTRSMLAMQRLQPEMKKLQQKYKQDKQQLNEEMMKLYREHNVNPASGCLPMVIQFPVFIILYDVIRGLTNTNKVHGRVVANPRYISHFTRLYANLHAHPGKMESFGINLAATLFTHRSSALGYVPYAVLILAAIALQYLQMRQMSRRNPAAAQANPQMQAMQKYMPLIFAVIYLRIAAGVNVYFIVSAACRIGIQEWVFRSGILDKPARSILPGSGSRSTAGSPRKTLMERLADAQQRALEQQRAQQTGRALQAGLPVDTDGNGRDAVTDGRSSNGQSGNGKGAGGGPRKPGAAAGGSKAGAGPSGASKPPPPTQNRSKSKKTRKAR